jgi:hypothetical protein
MTSDAEPNSHGSLPTLVCLVKADCARDDVDTWIAEILAYLKPDPFQTSFGEELRDDLSKSNFGWLGTNAYWRLGNWCHPKPDTPRTRFIKPRARKISVELFGQVIDRWDSEAEVIHACARERS